VVVGDFDFFGIATFPAKADAILIINPEAVLASAVPVQRFQAVAGRNRELPQFPDPVELRQFSAYHGPKRDRAGGKSASAVHPIKEVLRGRIRKGPYHGKYYNGLRVAVKRRAKRPALRP
jgi:hypothetical protein